MVEAQVVETIRCKPDELLEFVMDIERYAEVDAKIRSLDWARREGELTEFKFRPKLPGVPLPSPKWVQQIRLTPRAPGRHHQRAAAAQQAPTAWWLQAGVRDEIRGAKAYLERGTP